MNRPTFGLDRNTIRILHGYTIVIKYNNTINLIEKMYTLYI